MAALKPLLLPEPASARCPHRPRPRSARWKRRPVSRHTTAAPPTAREARWTKCPSSGSPSSEEYWQIGETAMRFRNTTPFSRNSLNRSAIPLPLMKPPIDFVPDFQVQNRRIRERGNRPRWQGGGRPISGKVSAGDQESRTDRRHLARCSFFTTASPTPPALAGFCPVMSNPSSTTCDENAIHALP